MSINCESSATVAMMTSLCVRYAFHFCRLGSNFWRGSHLPSHRRSVFPLKHSTATSTSHITYSTLTTRLSSKRKLPLHAVTDPTMANSQIDPAVKSDLYKAFFDDATLSDLTIQLSDRTVRVHRIVLCRKSEYFTKLLTGRFQVCSDRLAIWTERLTQRTGKWLERNRAQGR